MTSRCLIHLISKLRQPVYYAPWTLAKKGKGNLWSRLTVMLYCYGPLFYQCVFIDNIFGDALVRDEWDWTVPINTVRGWDEMELKCYWNGL